MRAFPLTAVALFLFSLAPAGIWSEQLQCNPCSHRFGRVEVGSSKSFSIQLTNTGTKSLSILSKSKQGSEFKFGHFPTPITLGPGKTVLFPIVFKPTVIGHVTGSFTLVSTALDTSLSMPVAGTGSPLLTVTPSTLNFGNVTVGKSASLPVTLSASKGKVTLSSDQFNSSEAHRADLSWQEGDPAVVGYNIYRGAAHGGPYHRINTALDASTNYTDATVAAGTTYYYVTTAVNGAGNESLHSNEAKAVIPSP